VGRMAVADLLKIWARPVSGLPQPLARPQGCGQSVAEAVVRGKIGDGARRAPLLEVCRRRASQSRIAQPTAPPHRCDCSTPRIVRRCAWAAKCDMKLPARTRPQTSEDSGSMTSDSFSVGPLPAQAAQPNDDQMAQILIQLRCDEVLPVDAIRAADANRAAMVPLIPRAFDQSASASASVHDALFIAFHLLERAEPRAIGGHRRPSRPKIRSNRSAATTPVHLRCDERGRQAQPAAQTGTRPGGAQGLLRRTRRLDRAELASLRLITTRSHRPRQISNFAGCLEQAPGDAIDERTVGTECPIERLNYHHPNQ
jgi:hypothetical protein